MTGQDVFFTDAIAAGLAVLAVAEIVASQIVARQPSAKLMVVSLLFWEGVAMLACACVIYVRQEIFEVATIVSVIAIWMAGAAVGLLRAGVFDPPPE
ncbi:MAG: hypothetical protein K8S25_03890 [Alphaproteobacteria bacterium]|nr:hypothetical protein [Alphaproteobacteria bacterium]